MKLLLEEHMISTVEYRYNNHDIKVSGYRDYVNEYYDVVTFYEIVIDGEYLDQGYLTVEDARQAAEDFIDCDLQSL